MINFVYVEKYNASDDSFFVNEIYIQNGERIGIDDLILSIESSKADIDIESKFSGFFYHNLKINQEINVGDLFFIISDEELDDYSIHFNTKSLINETNNGLTISSKAKKIIEKNNIDPILIGKNLIREKDVIDYLSKNTEKSLDINKKIIKSFGKIDEEKDILIIGGKGGCKMIIDAIESNNKFIIKGIIDNDIKAGKKVLNYKVIGNDSNLEQLYKLGFRNLVLSFSMLNNLKKRSNRIEFYSELGFNFPNIIHKNSIIEPSVNLGIGNVILAGAILGSEVIIGNMNYINTGAIICHESIVKNNNHFAPNSTIAGRVSIGNNNLIGMSVTTFFDLKIGDNNIINNGYNLITDIENDNILKNK